MIICVNRSESVYNYNQDIKQNVPHHNSLVELFTKAYKSQLTRGITAKLYKSITNLNSHSTKYIMDKWEKEAGITITEEEWECICTSQWRSTKSHTWKEFCWKSVTRFFITPQQSAHFSQGNSCCWRNCGCQIAHHFHVFWDCHVLQKYWYDVNNAIKHIFHTNIPLDFKTMFLGYKTQAMQTLDGYLWYILLAAAKKSY